MNPFELDMALARPVFAMNRRGIRVDREKQEELGITLHEKWSSYQEKLDEIAGAPVNVNSSPQCQALLYEAFGVKKRMRKKKPTTDEDALRSIMAEAEAEMHEKKMPDSVARWTRAYLATKLILLIRGTRKQISSYVGCPEAGCSCRKPSIVSPDSDDRMRTMMTIGGTETMRFSHSKTLWGTGLNLATVPHAIRVMYVADEGYELAELDLNRGESWVYAHLSEDPELMRIHQGGHDFHSESASTIQTAFGTEGLTAEEIAARTKAGDFFTYKLRYLGKRVNHASAYRMGPFKGASVVNEEADDTNITVTVAQMRKAQRLWKQKYFGIAKWWDDIDRQIRKTRRLTTPYGRVRQFFGYIDKSLLKEATAAVPQSTSVDYLNHGMLRVFDELVAKGFEGLELLHQNHDSILIQYPSGRRAEVLPAVADRLTSTIAINGHDVTIPIEASVGKNWGDWHEERNPDGLREVPRIGRTGLDHAGLGRGCALLRCLAAAYRRGPAR